MASLATQLDQLENAQLVLRLSEDEGAYLFKHALTQESAYQSLLLKKRREIHRHVAEAFERLYPDRSDEFAAVLSAHYAEAGDQIKTASYATRAGDRAARISAYVEARVHFSEASRALSRLPDTGENRRARIDIAIKQINVSWGIDEGTQNLQRLFDAEALARTLPEEDRRSLALVQYWIGRVYSYSNEHRKAFEYFSQVQDAALRSGDRELSAIASALGGRTLFLQGYFGRAVPLLEEAIDYFEHTSNWGEWILAKVSLAISLAARGQYGEARAHGDEAVRKALVLGDLASIVIARGMTARVELMAGNLEQMLIETSGMATESLQANPLVHYMVLGFQGWTEGRLGRFETARATMKESYAVAVTLGTRLIFSDWFAAARAEIELDAGAAEAALPLAEQAVAEARSTGGIFSEGIAQRVWGLAVATIKGTGDAEADAHLSQSLSLFEEGEAMIEAARTHSVWGQVLQRRGHRQGARDHYENAALRFHASGLTREFEQAEALIASLEQ